MEKVKILDKRFTLLLTLQLLILVLISSIMLFKKNNDQSPSALAWRAVGNSLQSVGLTQEALEAYEKALLYGTEDHTQKALLAYTIGGLYQELGLYEKALRFYYQTELLDPSFKEQAILNQKKVALLERLKKYSAVQRTLAESTALSSDKEEKASSGDPIIANVGGVDIYRHQVQTAYDNIPPLFKKNVGTLKDFAKKYVADQVLFEKAKRLGLDKDGRFREQLVQVERDLLVQKVIEEDVIKKVTVSESDLENYFKANQSHNESYKKAKSLQEIRQQVEADYRLEKQNARYQELIGESLKAQEVKLFFDRMDG